MTAKKNDDPMGGMKALITRIAGIGGDQGKPNKVCIDTYKRLQGQRDLLLQTATDEEERGSRRYGGALSATPHSAEFLAKAYRAAAQVLDDHLQLLPPAPDHQRLITSESSTPAPDHPARRGGRG
jgi:hypothetical protein